MSIGERLKKARKASALKQEDVAAASKLGVSSISEFENGTREPKTVAIEGTGRRLRAINRLFLVRSGTGPGTGVVARTTSFTQSSGA